MRRPTAPSPAQADLFTPADPVRELLATSAIPFAVLVQPFALQHELDHLDGVMFFQRMEPAGRRAVMAEIRGSEWFNR